MIESLRPTIAFTTALLFALGGSPAQADCTPLKSEVVSLGEKAARFYSERSLGQEIEAERRRLEATGKLQGRVTKAMTCQPFPNVIGADEWRCVGEAKVCTKEARARTP